MSAFNIIIKRELLFIIKSKKREGKYMNKFLVKCPRCNTYHEASSSFFAKKILNCTCGKIIDTRKERYTIKECSHCGNSVMYDSA